jgi:uncharacterized GH25 family protein
VIFDMTSFRHRLFALAFAGSVSVPALAHDFWIQPDKFTLAAGDRVALSLQVGHGPDRQASPIPARRIRRFAQMTPAGEAIDLRGPGIPALRTGGEGVHVLVLETDDKAQSHLSASRFNAYLKAEGLTPALLFRASSRAMNNDGAERYSRIAKAIIEVGRPGLGKQHPATTALGLRLEIVLERSPYARPRSGQLPLRVIYEGRALAGALVKLTDLDNDAAPAAMSLTNAQGHAEFAMPEKGNWLLNVIWTKPVQQADGIDFDTTFSSLSFGVSGL